MEDTAGITSGTTETAAPSTSAGTATITPDQRPTFAQAFASDAATPIETPAQPEAATTQPADATTAQALPTTSEPTGPIPLEVHRKALENARTKARTEVEAELGWAKTVDRASYEEAMRIGQMYQTDRPAYIRQVLSEALASPELAPLVRSEAARVLGSRQKEQTPSEIEPDIPVVDDRGNVVSQAFSAGKVKELIARAVQDAIGKEVAPMKADFQTRQQQEQHQKEQAHLESSVKTLYEQATSELPHFKEHEAEISKAFADIPGDPAVALHRAWAKVVLPKLEAKNQSKTLDELKTKAAASTVNPAGAVVAATKRPRSMTDPSLQW